MSPMLQRAIGCLYLLNPQSLKTAAKLLDRLLRDQLAASKGKR